MRIWTKKMLALLFGKKLRRAANVMEQTSVVFRVETAWKTYSEVAINRADSGIGEAGGKSLVGHVLYTIP